MLKHVTKYCVVLSCSVKGILCWAVNPVDVVLAPQTGLPATTLIGNQYSSAYTFTNNHRLPIVIQVTGQTDGSDFRSDELCANVTLSPKGQPGSSCTTYIALSHRILGVPVIM